jgi:MbtH protein
MYSIWPTDRETPSGWAEVGKVGSKEACLAYIEEVWTDMRPAALQLKMEEAAQKLIRDAR